MEIEDRINAIETELKQTKDDLKEILFDIQNYLSELPSPAPDGDPAKPKVKRG